MNSNEKAAVDVRAAKRFLETHLEDRVITA